MPKSNTAFWEKKFIQNVERDKRNLAELEALGWSVGVIWECSVRSGTFKNGHLEELIFRKISWVI